MRRLHLQRYFQRRPRALAVRVGLTGIDQAVSSLGNFAVGVAVARVAGIAALGEYSLAYATWLVVAALHRSLITDPMAIETDVNQADASFHVKVGLAAELVLGLTAAALFGVVGLILLAVGQHAFGISYVTFAPFLPFLVAQDYWRWVAFMTAKPAKALINDILFDLVQAGTFVLLLVGGDRSATLAIVAWGVGSAAGTLLGLWQFSVRPTLVGGLQRLRFRWSMSKWLVASSAASMGSAQAVIVLAASILGPTGIGGYRAALSLVSGPSLVLIQAGGSIGLPEAARALHQRGWLGLRRVQRAVTLAGVVSVGPIAIVVLLFSKRLLMLIYGHQFGRFASTADILAISFIAMALHLGAILSLKTTKLMRLLYWTSLLSLVVTLAATAVLAPLFGVLGAAEASLASTTIITLTLLLLHWRYSRPAAELIWKQDAAEAVDGLALVSADAVSAMAVQQSAGVVSDEQVSSL
jgi:O-antigen/teichoic acid export membrane protein